MPKLLTTWGLVMLLATSSLLTTQVLVPAGQIDSRPTRSAGKTPASAPAEPAPEVSVIDVALATGHTLAGRVVDTQGQPRAAAVVTLVRGRRVIAHARTDRSGRYALTNLAGGLYQLKVDDTLQLVRAWEAGTAPGLSQSSVEVVADPPVVRAQDEAAEAQPASASGSSGLFGGSALSAGVGTAIVVGVVVGGIYIIEELDGDEPGPASP